MQTHGMQGGASATPVSALEQRTCHTQLAPQAGGYVGLRWRVGQQKAEQANAGAAKSRAQS